MPVPMVKRGTKVKPRSRNSDGTFRKKRSDKGRKRLYNPVTKTTYTLQSNLPKEIQEIGRCTSCRHFFPLNNGCGKHLKQVRKPELGCRDWESKEEKKEDAPT